MPRIREVPRPLLTGQLRWLSGTCLEPQGVHKACKRHIFRRLRQSSILMTVTENGMAGLTKCGLIGRYVQPILQGLSCCLRRRIIAQYTCLDASSPSHSYRQMSQQVTKSTSDRRTCPPQVFVPARKSFVYVCSNLSVRVGGRCIPALLVCFCLLSVYLHPNLCAWLPPSLQKKPISRFTFSRAHLKDRSRCRAPTDCPQSDEF